MKDPAYKDYRQAVARAVRLGIIPKSIRCQQCGQCRSRIVGHHSDYAKPLLVVWLCQRCHSRHHYPSWYAAYKEQQNRAHRRLEKSQEGRLNKSILHDLEVFPSDEECDRQRDMDFQWLTRTMENSGALSGRNRCFGFLNNE